MKSDRLLGYNFKLFLPPTLLFLFCIPTDNVWLLSPSPAFSLIRFLLFHSVCVCNTTVCGVSQGYSALVKMCCSMRASVKVISRRMRERTIEKLYIHTYIADFH